MCSSDLVFSTDVTKEGKDLYVETEYKTPGLFPLTSKLIGRSLPFLPFSWYELKSNYKMRIEK